MHGEEKCVKIECLLSLLADMQALSPADRLTQVIQTAGDMQERASCELDDEELCLAAGGIKEPNADMCKK